MARYRTVDVRVWGDERVRRLSRMQPSGQGLWFYMLTNPNTTMLPGLFRAGEAQMAEELRWSLEAFRKAFGEVTGEGLAEADWEARVVWIPKACKYNPPASPNVVVGWADHLDEIPECELKAKALAVLGAFCQRKGEAFGKAFQKALAKASAKALLNQEQEQDQGQEQEQVPPNPPSASGRAQSGTRHAVPRARPTPDYLP